MIHLAYIFERFPTFTQTFCVREVLELERLGVRLVIFSLHDTRDETVQNFPRELFERVHYLPPPEELVAETRRLMEARKMPQSVVLTLRLWGERSDKLRVYEAAWIGWKLRELGVRVRHAHSHFAGMGARACWWLRKFHGLSYSFTAHANDIFCEPGAQFPPMPALYQNASLVVTESDYAARLVRDQFPDVTGRMRRVHNGLDIAPFAEARGKADRSRATGGILSVGRLIEKKGHDDLITACGLLRDRGMNFRCRIVGEGPLEQELRAQISNLKLTDRVTLLGSRSMSEIMRLLAEETQIFALACKTERDGGKDNLPTVLMDAMAAGLPCVSTRLAGVPEMVVDGVTGLLCNENQPEQFAGLLAALLEDPARSEKLGAAGLDRARRLFAKEVTSRELLRAFAAHSAMRFDVSLAARERLFGGFLKRLFNRDPQLRHQTVKARDKTFDLDRFMGGA